MTIEDLTALFNKANEGAFKLIVSQFNAMELHYKTLIDKQLQQIEQMSNHPDVIAQKLDRAKKERDAHLKAVKRAEQMIDSLTKEKTDE